VGSTFKAVFMSWLQGIANRRALMAQEIFNFFGSRNRFEPRAVRYNLIGREGPFALDFKFHFQGDGVVVPKQGREPALQNEQLVKMPLRQDALLG